MVSLKPGISLKLSDYKRIQDAQQQDMKNMGHGSYRILGKKTRTFHFFKDLFIWHRMTPSLYTCCFVCVFCLWCDISASSVNQSHQLHKVFLLSALNELTQTLYWGSNYHLLLYRHWPFCPFDCVATIIPIQNNIENIHTSVPRKGFQTFQIHRWRGCSLIAIPPSRKQEGLVTRVLQIIKKWTITWILKINLLEKNHHCHAYT